jgi:hypothetical protein
MNPVDRRRFPRHSLCFPLRLREADCPDGEADQTITENISFGGAYLRTLKRVKVGDKVHVMICVPEDMLKKFPFNRLVGESRVVRVEQPDEAGEKMQEARNIALEFGQDMIRLAAIR